MDANERLRYLERAVRTFQCGFNSDRRNEGNDSSTDEDTLTHVQSALSGLDASPNDFLTIIYTYVLDSVPTPEIISALKKLLDALLAPEPLSSPLASPRARG
jgi:hypothetical protein